MDPFARISPRLVNPACSQGFTCACGRFEDAETASAHLTDESIRIWYVIHDHRDADHDGFTHAYILYDIVCDICANGANQSNSSATLRNLALMYGTDQLYYIYTPTNHLNVDVSRQIMQYIMFHERVGRIQRIHAQYFHQYGNTTAHVARLLVKSERSESTCSIMRADSLASWSYLCELVRAISGSVLVESLRIAVSKETLYNFEILLMSAIFEDLRVAIMYDSIELKMQKMSW
jgi:hypothetical protein